MGKLYVSVVIASLSAVFLLTSPIRPRDAVVRFLGMALFDLSTAPVLPFGFTRSSPSGGLARISHRLTAEARDRPAITSLHLLAVLNVLSEYASARQAARASY